MNNGSQSLINLYCDLIENTPSTMTITIPEDLGTGNIIQTTTKQGVVISDWKMHYFSDMSVQGINSAEYIQIIFCISEGISWGAMGQQNALRIQKGETFIHKGHGETEYTCYNRDRDFHFKSIKIPVAYFSGILKDYFEHREIFAYENKLLNGACKVETTPTMEHILSELKDFALYRGGLGHLFLESKVLEMLSIYLSEVLELDILFSGAYPISRTDREAFIEAKRLIDTQIFHAPSCVGLAKQIGMSVSKLSKGFVKLYGKPIHTYIIDQRLEKAASLLIESDLPMYQVAALVGYAKPSNFSAAFKKKYGLLPKQYRKNNCKIY